MDIGFHSRRIESDSHCGNLFRPGDARHCIVDTFSSHRADTFERPIVKLMVRLHLLPRTGEVLKEFPFRDPHPGITERRALRHPHYQYLRPQGSRDEKSFQTPSEISVDPIENFRGFIEDLANTLVIFMILPYFLRGLSTLPANVSIRLHLRRIRSFLLVWFPGRVRMRFFHSKPDHLHG